MLAIASKCISADKSGYVAILIVVGFVALLSRLWQEKRGQMIEKTEKTPTEPAPMAVRCEATIPFGWLALPTQCWRKRGHERFGVKHYAKGDGTNFSIAE